MFHYNRRYFNISQFIYFYTSATQAVILTIYEYRYYSATIIKMSGVRDQSDAIWLAAGTAGVNFVFTIVALFLVERLGRRKLIISSLFGTTFYFCCFISMPQTHTLDNTNKCTIETCVKISNLCS